MCERARIEIEWKDCGQIALQSMTHLLEGLPECSAIGSQLISYAINIEITDNTEWHLIWSNFQVQRHQAIVTGL